MTPDPWYKSHEEIGQRLYELGLRQASLTDAADVLRVRRSRLIEYLRKNPRAHQLYRQGYAQTRLRIQSTITQVALHPGIHVKDRLGWMRMLTKMVGLDAHEPDTVDKDEDGAKRVQTFLEIALRAEEFESKMDNGELRTDPVSGRRPRGHRRERHVQSFEE